MKSLSFVETERSATRTPSGFGSPQNSLFSDILDWLLAPLLLIWPVVLVLTYFVAHHIANAPFDRSLADSVLAIAQQVQFSSGRATFLLPSSARALLRADETDSIFFQVVGPRGEFLSGEPDLPMPAINDMPLPGVVHYRNTLWRSLPLRVAYVWVASPELPSRVIAGQRPVLVQVGETLDKRTQLAHAIIQGVMAPQLLLVPLVILLVWLGLRRGVKPLTLLQRHIHARAPDDLSPLDTQQVPQEMAPLVIAFNQLLNRLGHILNTQQRFVANAAHQMKTPLAGLRMQAELALQAEDKAELDTSLNHIISSAQRATHLINQLLSLARAENTADNSGERFGRVALLSLTRQLAQEWVPAALQADIDWGFDAKVNTEIWIQGQPVLLQEMIGNLIDNALRYTPAEGTVTLRLCLSETDSQRVEVQIDDTGPGIPPNAYERVFDRFSRLLENTAEGSGLGLPIVREIARRHQAVVALIKNPDHPTGMRISLSFAKMPALPATAA